MFSLVREEYEKTLRTAALSLSCKKCPNTFRCRCLSNLKTCSYRWSMRPNNIINVLFLHHWNNFLWIPSYIKSFLLLLNCLVEKNVISKTSAAKRLSNSRTSCVALVQQPQVGNHCIWAFALFIDGTACMTYNGAFLLYLFKLNLRDALFSTCSLTVRVSPKLDMSGSSSLCLAVDAMPTFLIGVQRCNCSPYNDAVCP